MKKSLNIQLLIILVIGVIAGSAITLVFTAGGQPDQTIPGDINRDGKVDTLDLSILLENWTDKGTPAPETVLNNPTQ